MTHVFELTVRSTDLDMLGHVNHAKYLEYMEWARIQWMKDLGLSMQGLTKRGIIPVVVNVNVNYRKELTLDERVKVVSRPHRLGNKSTVVRQELFNESGDLVCDAEVTWVVIDAETRRVTSLPGEIRELFLIAERT